MQQSPWSPAGLAIPASAQRNTIVDGARGATIGAIVGLFFGLVGIILGPFIGAVIGELSGGSDMVSSGRAGLGAWIGMVVATAVKLGIAFLMIGIVVFQLGFSQAVGVTS